MTLTSSPPTESVLDPDLPPGFDLAGALRTLCGSVAEVVAITASPPSRVSVSVGAVRLEAEWPSAETAAGPEAGRVLTGPAPSPGPAPAPAAVGATLNAPLVGTFYRAPEPGLAAFVQVGDQIRAGDQVGIIEAMKLMNPIVAERPGRVVEMFVDDAEAVEFGQPLLMFEPDQE